MKPRDRMSARAFTLRVLQELQALKLLAVLEQERGGFKVQRCWVRS